MNAKELTREHVKRQRADLLEQLNKLETSERRLYALAGIVETMPKKILNRCYISWYGYDRYFSADIRPKFGETFTEHDTILITDWCAKQEKWTFNKEADGYGGWRHVIKRKRPNWRYANYEITFVNIDNIDGCELVEVIETREVKTYKVKC